jgi:DNA repair protein RecO (recombination protein O)
MSGPRTYRTEAIVLKAYDFGEADRILTLYTPHFGKIRATAKGIRRIKSRKAGHLDLFMRTNLLVASGRNLDIVTQAENIENFREMRENLYRSSYGHYVAELIDAFAPERMANSLIYDLLIDTLRRLATAEALEMSVRSFELRLLGLAGYRPQLFQCLQCNATAQPRVNRFSAQIGGLLCPECAATDRSAPNISVNALKVLRYLQADEAAIFNVRQLDPEVAREVERHLQECISYRLEKRPQSLRFLDRLRVEGAQS